MDPGIFNRQRNIVGNGRQQINVRLVEISLLFIDGTKDTDQAALDLNGHIQHVPGLIVGFFIHLVKKMGIAGGVVHD